MWEGIGCLQSLWGPGGKGCKGCLPDKRQASLGGLFLIMVLFPWMVWDGSTSVIAKVLRPACCIFYSESVFNLLILSSEAEEWFLDEIGRIQAVDMRNDFYTFLLLFRHFSPPPTKVLKRNPILLWRLLELVYPKFNLEKNTAKAHSQCHLVWVWSDLLRVVNTGYPETSLVSFSMVFLKKKKTG
jgi:hypothetical protein